MVLLFVFFFFFFFFNHLRFIFKALLVAERLRAIFSMDCAIPDTSMVFGTVVDHDRLSIFRYRTTLTNVHCVYTVHFRATRFWYKHENCVRYNTMAYLFIRIMKLGTVA